MRNGVPAYSITLPTIPTQWHIAGVGDFLGTGQADLVWEDTTTKNGKQKGHDPISVVLEANAGWC